MILSVLWLVRVTLSSVKLSLRSGYGFLCCSVVLLVMLYKVVLTFESVHEIQNNDHSNDERFKQFFPVVLSKVVLTFESVDEILMCDHSNESCCLLLSCCNISNVIQGVFNFQSG